MGYSYCCGKSVTSRCVQQSVYWPGSPGKNFGLSTGRFISVKLMSIQYLIHPPLLHDLVSNLLYGCGLLLKEFLMLCDEIKTKSSRLPYYSQRLHLMLNWYWMRILLKSDGLFRTLEITRDNCLNFNYHTGAFCLEAAGQRHDFAKISNALIQLKT